MRNNGKRGGGAVDPGDSQSQVMSPQLPPSSHGSAVSVQSVPVQAVSMSGFSGPVSPSQNQNFIHAPSPVSLPVPVFLIPLCQCYNSFNGTL